MHTQYAKSPTPAYFGPIVRFEVPRGTDGKLRIGLWDRGMTPGQKLKDGQESDFSAVTFAQMIGNWKRRGEPLAGCYNHQSAYVQQNGQPAPALAWYDAIAIIENGEVTQFEKLSSSNATPPSVAELAGRLAAILATDENPNPSADGAWFYRSEVTEKGEELLPNFRFISPMFTSKGADEQGNAIGYVIYDLAFTNTAFQAGCMINFSQSGGQAPKEKPNMAIKKFAAEFAKKMGLLEGADDETIKASFATKMEEAKAAMSAEEEPSKMAKHAADMEEMAKQYEDAYSEEGEEGEAPHVSMRKMATKFRKLAALEGGAADDKEKDKDNEGAAEFERRSREELSLFASRMNVTIPDGASSKQILETIRLSSVPASKLPELIAGQVKAALDREKSQATVMETKAKAKVLVEAAIAGGYDKDNGPALLAFASEPGSFAAAQAMAAPFLKLGSAGAELFSRLTGAGAPVGVDARRATFGAGSTSGPDRKIVKTPLATFSVEGARFSDMAKEMADAKEGPIKMQIDGMLPSSIREHSGERLIVANQILKETRPELFEAAEDPQLFGM